MHKKVVDLCGDRLSIHWDGNVWVSPTNGQQHSRATNAMRTELEVYFRASGEDVEDDAISEQIEGYLSQMEDEEG